MIKYRLRNTDKVVLEPEDNNNPNPNKPKWLRIKLPINSKRLLSIKALIRQNGLHSVCEEASCPNMAECFNQGKITFLILGEICTRRCPFCNIGHGRPLPPNVYEPQNLAKTIKDMNLYYVVLTSVDRDDLRDGGAQHFVECIRAIKQSNTQIKIEILVPDFRGCQNDALKILSTLPPDVFNHNIETVPKMYSKIRPGANYTFSLKLLKNFKKNHPNIPTKSGLMVGLGENYSEIIQVMQDLRLHGVTMLTIGQYLQPSPHHFPVKRYVSPDEFLHLKEKAIAMGFQHAACGPLVRSSYHADLQATYVKNQLIKNPT
ncbi:MAG: lipoyl synthase [Candidatus Dasytiphilus stammeri]